MNHQTHISACMALWLEATVSSAPLSRLNVIFILTDDLDHMDINAYRAGRWHDGSSSMRRQT